MTINKLTSREFHKYPSRARKASASGFITDRGRPVYVLLSIEEDQRITRSQASIIDLLAMPDVANIDFTPPQFGNDYQLHSPIASHYEWTALADEESDRFSAKAERL